jgi:hypothetical protein
MSPFLYFVIGVLAVAGLVGLANWFATISPSTLARAIKWLLVAVVLVLGVYLVLANPRLVLLVLLIGVPLLFLRRGWFGSRPWRSGPGSGGGVPPGGAGGQPSSRVETATLRMSLDVASGAMTGQVLRGSFAGRTLDSLTQAELLALRGECERTDPQSVPLVESYLDRRFGPDWRTTERGADTGEAPGRSADGPMSSEEAREILGVEPGAGRDVILAAWRRLIKLNHPDHGGSKYIAAKLNEAKRILLGE